MNVVVLVGRLTRDPELRYTQSNMAVCTTSLAVDRPPRRDASGNPGEKTADFIRITLFGKQAETFSRYLTKGQQVAVEGNIRTGSYVNQKGDTVYTTEVVVNRFDFIGNRRDSAGQGGYAGNAGYQNAGGYGGQNPGSYGQGGYGAPQGGAGAGQQPGGFVRPQSDGGEASPQNSGFEDELPSGFEAIEDDVPF